jgi:SAM-dependent methyltransferase
MNLIEEYKKQQTWRNWESYLDLIPIKETDIVLDLGCSVGNVSHLLANKVSHVTGIDLNSDFIQFCDENKSSNEQYICSNFLDLDFSKFPCITGLWGSFSLSYLADPKPYLDKVYMKMDKGSWIALLDVSCFISGNMNKQSKFYEKVRNFELESCKSGVYDFNFGAKLKPLLNQSGFKVIHCDESVHDVELNFNGCAKEEVVAVWRARLSRLVLLKRLLDSEYCEFEREFLAFINSDSHEQRNSLQFVVAIK